MDGQRHRVVSELDREELVCMTREILEIPSPTGEEAAAAEYIAAKFRGLGLEVHLQEVEPHRSNVICTWKGSGGGKSLMFKATWTLPVVADLTPFWWTATGSLVPAQPI